MTEEWITVRNVISDELSNEIVKDLQKIILIICGNILIKML